MLCGVDMVLFRPDFLVQKLFVLALLLLLAGPVCAQSTDPSSPWPVRSNTVTARIAARDLGDARLTDHYYAFTGTPGDLLITIQSNNLNGDVDIFTASTLRPLAKITLYAEISTPVTKGIYLRRREDLILRVEARSPNDDEGIYRVTFGGSFAPIVGGPDLGEAETPSTTPAETSAAGRKGKRVSSSGARIEEPAPPVTEVAAAPTPEPTPEATPEPKPVETPKTEEKAAEEKPAKPAPVRNTRTRRPAGRRPAPAPTPRTRDTVAATETPKPKQPPVEPEPEVGPRLVIETNDGTLINRSMSTVKRVTVENGQVVVIGKDGKIERILLINVVRMSIAP
jgi:hypothetical protein